MIISQELKDNIKRICRGLGAIGISMPKKYIEEESYYAKHWYTDTVMPPDQMSIEVSSRCNLRCKTCSLAYSETPGEDMPLELFEKILSQTSSFCNSYNLHGIGESLMHPEFVKFAQLVKAENALCRLTTNGLLMNRECAHGLINARMDSITVSIDAATPETYLKIRSSKLFDKVIDNLKGLVELKKEHGLGRPVISSAFLCVKDNIDELLDFVKLSVDCGVDTIFIQSYENRGWGFENQLSSQDKNKNIIAEAVKVAQENHTAIQFDFPERIAIETGGVEIDDMPVWDRGSARETNHPRFRACEAPFVHGIIRANGDVDTCYYGETVGNLYKNTFMEIWNGRKMRDFRKRIRNPENQPQCCQECTAKGWHYYQLREEISDSFTVGKHDFSQVGLGWHIREYHGETPFRFTDSEASVFIKNTGKDFLLLELSVISESYKEAKRHVKIYVNSHFVTEVVVDTIWRPFFVKLPVIWNPFLKITLRVDENSVPCKTIESFDTRRLGIAVARIELRAKCPEELWVEEQMGQQKDFLVG